MVELIGQLYTIEAGAKRVGPEARAKLRAEQSEQVVGEIRRWLIGRKALPRSRLGQVIRYTEHRAYLKEATVAAIRTPGTVTLPSDLK